MSAPDVLLSAVNIPRARAFHPLDGFTLGDDWIWHEDDAHYLARADSLLSSILARVRELRG
ncbi:hypothetical protein [Paraburkholderia phosphatilytica]|uniref:hypothetical protein n=1 Tax=Paraburkholderia phosphatilytica TaxID=2282883 RepID=UPI000E54D916|nr:hypothetical protein [Paraburkholderia phosphatilytica]